MGVFGKRSMDLLRERIDLCAAPYLFNYCGRRSLTNLCVAE